MSFVDLSKDDEWDEVQARNRAQAILDREFPGIQALRDRVAFMSLGGVLLDPQETAATRAFARRTLELEGLVAATLRDTALLRRVKAVEAAWSALRALPPPPEAQEGEEAPDDPYAAQRAELEAAATPDPDIADLCTNRGRMVEPEPEPEEPAPEEPTP